MTGAELDRHVSLALAAEREQAQLLGRALHAAELEWLIMAVFRHKHGAERGEELARVAIDVIELMRGEVG